MLDSNIHGRCVLVFGLQLDQNCYPHRVMSEKVSPRELDPTNTFPEQFVLVDQSVPPSSSSSFPDVRLSLII